jgi:adenylate kinase
MPFLNRVRRTFSFFRKRQKSALVILEKPGVGKGTQGKLLERIYGTPHISSGDLLREEIKRGTPLGLKIKGIIDRGGIATQELGAGILIDLLEKKLSGKNCKNGMILDGITRTKESVEALDLFLKKHRIHLTAVIYLNTPDDVLLKKIRSRVTCERCGTTYNISVKPPKKAGKCDSCKGTLGVRMGDEDPEKVRQRIEKHHNTIGPILDAYSQRGVLRRVQVAGGKARKSIARTNKLIRCQINLAQRTAKNKPNK